MDVDPRSTGARGVRLTFDWIGESVDGVIDALLRLREEIDRLLMEEPGEAISEIRVSRRLWCRLCHELNEKKMPFSSWTSSDEFKVIEVCGLKIKRDWID